MNTTTKTAELIRQRIEAMPIGEPFTPTALLECATRASVDRTLSRLVKAGAIERVTRGVFVRPEISRFVGKVSPSPLKVAETVAKTTGAVVQVHGAEAARRLELTTQVPTQSVFVTSGPSKHIRVGKMEIRLQHVCQRKLALAGRPAGLALAAMWYLGKKEVTPALVEKIRHKLGSNEFEALKSVTSSMPAWMSDAIFRNERAVVHSCLSLSCISKLKSSPKSIGRWHRNLLTRLLYWKKMSGSARCCRPCLPCPADCRWPSAVVLLPIHPERVPSVFIEANALISSAHTKQRLTVSLNGVLAASLALMEPSVAFEIKIPEAVKHKSRAEYLKLEFHFPDAARPKDIGLGDDGRRDHSEFMVLA